MKFLKESKNDLMLSIKSKIQRLKGQDFENDIETTKSFIEDFEIQDGINLGGWGIDQVILKPDNDKEKQIEILYFDDLVADDVTPTSEDIKTLNNFIDYLSSYKSMTICYSYEVQILKNNDPNKFSKSLDRLENISNSNGFKLKIEIYIGDANEVYDIKKAKFSIGRILKANYIVFDFERPIDISDFGVKDPIDSLPSNIIKDFKKFAERANLKDSDRKDLVDLINKIK